MLRYIWNATRGHRLAPWRSPYLLWRIETYCGVKMQQIGFLEFWEFLWRERVHLWQFLKWTGEMERVCSAGETRHLALSIWHLARPAKCYVANYQMLALRSPQPLPLPAQRLPLIPCPRP